MFSKRRARADEGTPTELTPPTADIETTETSNPARPAGSTSPAEHDFGDGPVRAARHTNPDGTEGGWIAATAHADATVTVGAEAAIYGNARVFGTAELLDEARVSGNARVDSGALLTGSAHAAGNCTIIDATVAEQARIGGRAHLSGGARISGRAVVKGEARVMGPVEITDDATVTDRTWVSGGVIAGVAWVGGTTAVRPGDEHRERLALAPEPTASEPGERRAIAGGETHGAGKAGRRSRSHLTLID